MDVNRNQPWQQQGIRQHLELLEAKEYSMDAKFDPKRIQHECWLHTYSTLQKPTSSPLTARRAVIFFLRALPARVPARIPLHHFRHGGRRGGVVMAASTAATSTATAAAWWQGEGSKEGGGWTAAVAGRHRRQRHDGNSSMGGVLFSTEAILLFIHMMKVLELLFLLCSFCAHECIDNKQTHAL